MTGVYPPPRMSNLGRIVVGLSIAAALVGIVAVARAQTAPQQPPPESQVAQHRSGDARFQVQVTDEMRRHSRILDVLYFTGFVYGVAVLLLILATRLSARLRDLAARVTKRPFLVAMLYVVLLTLVTTLLQFPLSYYSGFVVPHQFDLSNQSFGAWLADAGKSLGLSLVLDPILMALALLAIAKLNRWWLVLWLASIPLIILLVIVTPIFIDPMFNKFEPLKDEVLREKLLQTASRAGIEGSRVYQVDKSKQTKTMNAYVTGLGATKRIVMWDTILQKMTHDELVAVMGHEMGHYVMKHIWKTLAFMMALAFFVFFGAQRMYERGLARWGGRWAVAGKADPAALPWLGVIFSILMFLLEPMMNGYSRYKEHESDVFSLELTRLNEPLAAAFVKFAEDSKVDPNPHPFIEFWRYSHPSLGKRIEFVRSYMPWEKGEPNRAWQPSSPKSP